VAKCAIYIYRILGSPSFFMGEEKVPHVKHFKYLGIFVGDDDASIVTRKSRVEAAQRTVNRLWVNGLLRGMGAEAATTIWKAVIETSLTYGVEVWDNGDYAAIDAVQADLARKVMGTYQKKIPMAGLLTDLGWRKTSWVMKKKRLLFAARIRSPSAPPLLKRAAHWVIKDINKEQKKAQKSSNWEIGTDNLIKQLDLKQQWRNWCEGRRSKTGWEVVVEKAIEREEKRELQKATGPASKLRTFAKLKTTSGMEDYAKSLPRRDRRIIVELRCGVAHLEIETGRWDDVSVEERVCSFCPDKVEDEQHFLVECPKYAEARQELYQHLIDQGILIHQMNNSDQLKTLLTQCGKFKRVVKFIRMAWSLRDKARNELALRHSLRL
jgi:hypothetical protein